MAGDISGELDAAFATFDGIATDGTAGSHCHDQGDLVVVALVFADDVRGHVAALTTAQILNRLGNGARLDGRAPVQANPALACGCPTHDAAFYGLSQKQAAVFLRSLRYAMDMGDEPRSDNSSTTPDSEQVPETPLFVLLGRAFESYRGCYEPANAANAPSLGVWSNVLRAFDDGLLEQGELSRRAVVSRRAIRALVRDLERLRWLEVVKPARGKTALRLTADGRCARDTGARLVHEAESRFASRCGLDRTTALRDALIGLVGQLDVELPWHLTGYGLADSSLTGGDHVPGQTGPPRIPAHGADWPVVARGPTANVREQPLSALLSKALAAFRIDYEWDMRGHGTGLDFVANFLQFVDDEAVGLDTASTLGGVTGNGRSALERHLVVVAEPRQGRGVSRRVYLTPKGRQARDSYPDLVAKVGRDWRHRYGTCVDDLTSALDSLDEDFDADLPNFPSSTDWLSRSMLAGSATARARADATPD